MVSVITSTYKRTKKLKRAIKSVLRQDYKDFEYLIVEDGHTKETEDLVKSFDDKRVKYLSIKHFGSDTRPKNYAISQAKGEYIAYLDDDNEWRLGALKKLVNKIKEGYDIVYGDFWIKQSGMGISKEFDPQFLLGRNFIDMSTVIHTKEIVEKVGGFDETLKKFVDWNLWVRMMKYGAKFGKVNAIVLDYNVSKDAKSSRVKTESYPHPIYGTYFVPTFNPSGCKWKVGKRKKPKVAIFTLTYDRLEYTKRMYESMKETAEYDFDWFVWDNGSKDLTPKWLLNNTEPRLSPENVGITKASNALLDEILLNKYDIIGKVDNDCMFETYGWLKDIVDLWERNRMLYMSPYPEGLIANPGGGQRIGTAKIGDYTVEVANHIGGLCAFIDSSAYKYFRWTDKFLHGNQDTEASAYFRSKGYMPCYIPKHRVLHETAKQHKELKYYFDRRVKEKRTQV